MQLFGALGFRPELYRCVRCEEVLGPSANFFSPSAGGILCLSCGQSEPSARAITTNAFKVLRLFQSGDYSTVSRLNVDNPLRRELANVLEGYAEHLLERQVRSAELLTALRASTPEKASSG